MKMKRLEKPGLLLQPHNHADGRSLPPRSQPRDDYDYRYRQHFCAKTLPSGVGVRLATTTMTMKLVARPHRTDLQTEA